MVSIKVVAVRVNNPCCVYTNIILGMVVGSCIFTSYYDLDSDHYFKFIIIIQVNNIIIDILFGLLYFEMCTVSEYRILCIVQPMC